MPLTQSVQIMVVFPLMLSFSLGWDYDFHLSSLGMGGNRVSIIAPIGQQRTGADSLDQADSFFAISSGTLCDKDSDRHNSRPRQDEFGC